MAQKEKTGRRNQKYRPMTVINTIKWGLATEYDFLKNNKLWCPRHAAGYDSVLSRMKINLLHFFLSQSLIFFFTLANAPKIWVHALILVWIFFQVPCVQDSSLECRRFLFLILQSLPFFFSLCLTFIRWHSSRNHYSVGLSYSVPTMDHLFIFKLSTAIKTKTNMKMIGLNEELVK